MAYDLMSTKTNANTPLTDEEILSFAPAAGSDDAMPGLSKQYAKLNTLEIVQTHRDLGWMPIHVKQKSSNSPYSAHFVRYRHVDDITRYGDKPQCFEIVDFYSHNGTMSYRKMLGMNVFACDNGCVMGADFYQRLIHKKVTIDTVREMLERLVNRQQDADDRINAMRDVTPDRDTVRHVLERAAALRWEPLPEYTDEPKAGTYWDERTLSNMNRTWRGEDTGADLYTLYQRIQENLIRSPSVYVRTITEKKPYPRIRKARPINGPQADIELNTKLYDIIEEYI